MAREELALLKQAYPDAAYYLSFDTPFHLVLATILSAQCTDVVVNKTTPALFARYTTPADVVASSEEEVASYIRTVTYYQAKAKYIVQACRTLVEEFGSAVPKEIGQLTRLAGVGKKTANAIQQNAFGLVNGVIVDTHVIRLAQRLGWTRAKSPERIEKDLMAIFPESEWKRIPHLLKSHGQRICTARNPKCDSCVLRRSCPRIGL